VLKLLWAFTWQEGIFKYPFLYNAEWNVFGALLIPSVNHLANRLTGFHHADASYQESEAVYPGHEWCRVKHTAPHSKWHECAANGLMDLGYLADYFGEVVKAALSRPSRQEPRAQTDGFDIFISSSVVDEWAAEMQSKAWSEEFVVTQAFVRVVKNIVADMDRCGSGLVDGEVTGNELTCYLTGIKSGASFVGKLYKDISSYHQVALSQVHITPSASGVLV